MKKSVDNLKKYGKIKIKNKDKEKRICFRAKIGYFLQNFLIMGKDTQRPL